MLGLIEHLARQNREEVFIKAFQWILNLPNFILKKESKNQLISNLFETPYSAESVLNMSFTKHLGQLKLQSDQQIFYFAGLHQYTLNSEYYKKEIDNGSKVGLLHDNHSPDNLSTESTIIISYSKLIHELRKLPINDHKTQYIIGDLIDGIEKFEKVDRFE